MNTLVTGAAGFVGKKVVRNLLERGNGVVATDQKFTEPPTSSALTLLPGDLADDAFRQTLFDQDIDNVIHLAAVPGGTAEANPALSLRINVEATIDLMMRAGQNKNQCRFVYASSIAVLGDPLPKDGVDDETPLKPTLYYGMHKQMAEIALATLSRRNIIDGVGLRLPGIVARPAGATGLKSAFMSNLFHALLAGDDFICPVSAQAGVWIMSLSQVATNLVHTLDLNSQEMPADRSVTLPAIHCQMGDVIDAVARKVQADTKTVTFDQDVELEKAFGACPPLTADNAKRAGFADDGTLDQLVDRVIADIQHHD
jgi:nucleoside-diphosphate-sugar epimerase